MLRLFTAGSAKKERKDSRASKLILTVLAFFVTLLPLVSAGIWAKNTFFSDPRHTVTLATLPKPAESPKLFDEPMVSVTFDDGWESIYSKGAPILQTYNIRTTQYVLSGAFGFHNYFSREQLVSLQNVGHDIQSHTITHRDLTTLTSHDLTAELAKSKADLSAVLGREVTDFASPLNRHNDHVIDEIKKQYRSHRNTEADIDTLYDGSFNTHDSFNPYSISAFSVRRTTPLSKIQAFLEAAKAKKAWVVLVYHEVDEKSEDYYAVTPKQLDEQMAAVKASGLRVVTVDEALDAYESQKR